MRWLLLGSKSCDELHRGRVRGVVHLEWMWLPWAGVEGTRSVGLYPQRRAGAHTLPTPFPWGGEASGVMLWAGTPRQLQVLGEASGVKMLVRMLRLQQVCRGVRCQLQELG